MDITTFSLDVQTRLKEAFNNLLEAGFDPNDLDIKIIQGYATVPTNAAPVLELNNKNANLSGSTLLPGQELIQDNDAFIGVASVVGLASAAAVADLAFARIYPYADYLVWATGNVNNAAQSIFSSGKVSIKIGTRTAMQPRLMRFFERPYNPQAAAGTVAAPPSGPNANYTLLDKDYGFSGGNRNFFEFDLGKSVLTNLPATTYLATNMIGWGIVDGSKRVNELANVQNLCLVKA